MDLLKLYEALPATLENEESLDRWLHAAYKIPSYDLASVGGYRSAIYSQRLLVLNSEGKMVKGPKPGGWTTEDQHEYYRKREQAAQAERDKWTAAQIEQALEPAKREFASQLHFHLGDRLSRLEMELAELREQSATK
jgi:hypothetical protein